MKAIEQYFYVVLFIVLPLSEGISGYNLTKFLVQYLFNKMNGLLTKVVVSE